MISTINTSELDQIIIGRVKPSIYAFSTNTIPNYLKVGDTYRPVVRRLEEWGKKFPDLNKEFENTAAITDDVFFRDYSVHQYLKDNLNKHKLERWDIPQGVYYSSEFFKDVSIDDLNGAICDIQQDYVDHSGKYSFYSLNTRLPEKHVYSSTGMWDLRPNQEETVRRFKEAKANGRTNLLMYAVMRFGKSFTALCCAKEINAKLVLIVSGKADVKEEWKKTVESADNFNKIYTFISADDLDNDRNIIHKTLSCGEGAVVFLTLQDLQGDTIKDKHKELFGNTQIDLLIIDETHYGARADHYGQILRDIQYLKDVKDPHEDDDYCESEAANRITEQFKKQLNVKITLHLSGTPYRILMGSEFQKEDIIAFYQFTDIVNDQIKYDEEHSTDDDYKEWDNPYFGFPQMIRFAFTPNNSSLELLNSLKDSDTTCDLNELLRPVSVKKDKKNENHKKFVHEREVLELFSAIDGSQTDDNILPFLDYDKIKNGSMCHHIVIVLPYRASCDAVEELLNVNKGNFKNLSDYEIINISGVDSPGKYPTPKDVQDKIQNCENAGIKTITLTVNRMLTGSTVEQWDTMIFLKDTASPQEYDQAIFRLQNQFIKDYVDEKGNVIKYNMKPQTLLVDFDPHRMFSMQEQKAMIYNVNTDAAGNKHLQERIEKELQVSPILWINKDKMVKVEPNDILQEISQYNNSRGVLEETLSIPVDFSLLDYDEIKETISAQAAIGSKQGLSMEAYSSNQEDNNDDEELPKDNITPSESKNNEDQEKQEEKPEDSENDIKTIEKKFRTYYARILFFAYLTDDKVYSIDDILSCVDENCNRRIAKNIGISKSILSLIKNHINIFILQQLDYKIQNINMLSHDDSIPQMQRAETAIKRFGRISESEVPTPDEIAYQILLNIPDDCFITLPSGRLLDISSKMGEFAMAVIRRCEELNISVEKILKSILSIPSSSIAYEFTYKMYKILGLDTDMIVSNFTSYDLLEIKKENDGTSTSEIDYEYIKKILSQPVKASELSIHIPMKEVKGELKFNAIVGNPPYNENISRKGGNASLSKQLFPSFVMLVTQMNSDYVSLIVPSKWFLANAQDKSFIKLREYFKENNHIKSITNFTGNHSIFNDVNVGDVNYFLYEKDYEGDVEFTEVSENNTNTIKRPLFEKGLDIVIPINNINLFSILNKVRNSQDFISLTSITTGRNAFGIIGKRSSLNKISKSEYFDGAISLRCAHEEIRYVEETKITKNIKIMNSWKIMTSKSNGGAGLLTDNHPVSIIGESYLAGPKSACTDSLIPIGCFEDRAEAENLLKYMSTKFLRFMVGILKSSQNITQIVYQFVPIQNFTNDSDINWNTSVKEIDKQLYRKYNLSNEEIDYIEHKIKSLRNI